MTSSPLRRARLLASLVLAAAMLAGTATPASAGKGIVWVAACPGPDLLDPAAGAGTPLELTIRRHQQDGFLELETTGPASCAYVRDDRVNTRPRAVGVTFSVVLRQGTLPSGASIDEYRDLCDGRTVDNTTGAMEVIFDEDTRDSFGGMGVTIDGTGSELVIQITHQTDSLIIKAYGTFALIGERDCAGFSENGGSPTWEGPMLVVDPKLDQPAAAIL